MVKFTFNASSLEQHSAVQCFTTEFKNHNKPTGLRPHQTKETDETLNRNSPRLFDCLGHWRWLGLPAGGMVVNMNGGPAFPLHNHGVQTLGMHLSGMTLRDYFAAKVMQGMMANGQVLKLVSDETLASAAYEMADAMLKAREV